VHLRHEVGSIGRLLPGTAETDAPADSFFEDRFDIVTIGGRVVGEQFLEVCLFAVAESCFAGGELGVVAVESLGAAV
jgi:hypothetical protein